jgi:hypothetical protein
MLSLVGATDIKEPSKCFKITYSNDEVELVMATSLGITEDLKDFITFYTETKAFDEELVCMINQSLIRKIETVKVPKVSYILNGEKKYE